MKDIIGLSLTFIILTCVIVVVPPKLVELSGYGFIGYYTWVFSRIIIEKLYLKGLYED